MPGNSRSGKPEAPWRCPRLWPGSTIAILASGPSLAARDIDLVRAARFAGRCRAVAVNSTFRVACWSDALHSCDAAWWNQNQDSLRFPGLKTGLYQRGAEPWPEGVRRLLAAGRNGIATDPRYLATGKNSGHQAINLAVHLGAARIILLGFDFCAPWSGPKHHHPDHKAPLSNPTETAFEAWREAIATVPEPLARLGVDIINCSRVTAIGSLPRADLAQII